MFSEKLLEKNVIGLILILYLEMFNDYLIIM